MSKKFDLVVFGATSFVGQILCRYMMDEYGANGDVSWAIAGRSQGKLDHVKSSLGESAKDLPIFIADASDEATLKTLCDNANVIVSTVGPYALYGEPLVKVCVETGTDYVDLTGEVQWIDRMIEKYERTAQKTGARIVHCCGFDSIPSDMGVYHLQKEAKERFGETCTTIRMRVNAMNGAASGGTIASMINITKEATKDSALRKKLGNPYLLCPPGHGFKVRQPNVTTPVFDSEHNKWAAPFVMAGINTRIVHRSNALLDNAYGNNFKYDEAMLMGKGFKGRLTATGFTAGLGSFLVGAALAPSRWLLEKYVLPKPGEGPSPKAQERGFYDIRFIGETEKGEKIATKVTGDRDPGYGSTSKILAQAGISLAKDISKEDKAGGFWTTASIFDARLLVRLVERSGMTFDVLD